MNKQKKGIVKINRKDLESEHLDHVWPVLFSKFIPVHIENNHLYPYLDYYGYCEEFHESQQGLLLPEYEVLVTVAECAQPEVKFVLKEPYR